jgi:hypothetical protein
MLFSRRGFLINFYPFAKSQFIKHHSTGDDDTPEEVKNSATVREKVRLESKASQL